MTLPRIIISSKSEFQYRLLNDIGKGAFGNVYEAICIEKSFKYAIKELPKKLVYSKGYVRSNEQKHRIRQEIQIHESLVHPSIVRCYESFEDENNFYLVLELCKEDLEKRRQKYKDNKIDEDSAKNIIIQVADGILYLKSKKVLHRDLKLCNILIDSQENVKIADFGLAALVNESTPHKTLCGSLPFISPDVATRSNQNAQCDVWSFGCILYTLLVGYTPWKTEGKQPKAVITDIVQNDYREIPNFVSFEAADLIKRCLEKDQSKRITIENVCRHPFLKSSVYKNKKIITHHSDSGVGTFSSIETRTNFMKSSSLNEDKLNYQRYNPDHQNHAINHIEGSSHHILKSNTKDFPNLKAAMIMPDLKLLSDKGFQTNQIYHQSSYSTRKEKKIPSNYNDHSFKEVHDFGKLYNEYGNLSNEKLKFNSHLSRNHSDDILQHVRTSSLDRYKENSRGYWPYQNPGCNENSNSFKIFKNSKNKKYKSYSEIVNRQNSYSDSGHKRDLPNKVQSLNNEQRLIKKPLSKCNSSALNNNYHNYSKVLHEKYEQIPKLQDKCSQLSTRRLKAIRQKLKSFVFHILDDGDVCIEHISSKNGKERVIDACHITSDGFHICLYKPRPGADAFVTDTPYSVSGEAADLVYNFNTLPPEHFKKYLDAVRFVQMVKEKTPKITYYSDEAKCYLMENGPDPDFEAVFFSGESIIIGRKYTKIIDKKGKKIALNTEDSMTKLPEDIKRLLSHAQKIRKDCLLRENINTLYEEEHESPSFPMVIGKRPMSKRSRKITCIGKENISPSSVTSSHYTESKINSNSNMLSRDSQINKGSNLDKRRMPLSALDRNLQYTKNSIRSQFEPTKFHTQFGTLFEDKENFILKFNDGRVAQLTKSANFKNIKYIDSDRQEHLIENSTNDNEFKYILTCVHNAIKLCRDKSLFQTQAAYSPEIT